MDSTPPRPPNLSERSEMGERATERMQAQRLASEAEAAADQRSSGEDVIGIAGRIGRWLRSLRRQ